jgi:phosphomannomutase
VAANLSELCAAVRSHGAAAGFALDADADRLAIVDEAGRFIGEEYTLALSAAFMLTHRKGKVATNLVTSRMVDDVARAAGCEVVRAPTGEANVVEAMAANDCVFGGEGGGGAIDPRVGGVRDSLVGMACVLQYMAERGQAVSLLVDEIPHYVMLKEKLPCPAGAAAEVAAAARKAFEPREGVRFNDADGLRMDLPEGWVCARASNTEPIMRIIAEAGDADAARALIDEVRGIAERVIRPA